MTNFDRLKNMTIEEMAKAIGEAEYCTYKACPINCVECCLAWLKREESE